MFATREEALHVHLAEASMLASAALHLEVKRERELFIDSLLVFFHQEVNPQDHMPCALYRSPRLGQPSTLNPQPFIHNPRP